MAQVKTEQEMFPLVEAWLASDLTQKQFCATHQMPVHILAYWVGRHSKAQPAKATIDKSVVATGKASKKAMATASSSGFIRLSPPPISSLAPTPTGSMEVVMTSGALIRFSTTVPAGYLKELLSQCSH